MEQKKGLLQRLSFRAQFTSEQEMKKVELLATKDTIASAKRIATMLVYLDAAIVLIWLAYWRLGGNPLNVKEVMTYAALLAVSIVTKCMIKYVNQNIEERYRMFEWIGGGFAFLLILWADWITYLNTMKSGNFSIMIFFTIITIIPMSVFLKPVVYYPIQILGSLVIYIIILTCTTENQADNLANFTICFVFSTVSAVSFYTTRLKSYKQMLTLEEISERDPVSGLYNRLTLEEKSEEIWKECKQQNQLISCMFCEIDEFKTLNDTYGNRYGDVCVRNIADAIQENRTHTKCYAFRYRSEEFLVLLPGMNHAAACRWTEQLRDAVAYKSKKKQKFVVNFGVYTARPFEDSSRMEQYIVQADRLRYQAKQQGENCICSRDDAGDVE